MKKEESEKGQEEKDVKVGEEEGRDRVKERGVERRRGGSESRRGRKKERQGR